MKEEEKINQEESVNENERNNENETLRDENEDGNKNESGNTETSEEKDPLEVAQEEIEQLRDKYLRSVAEFDNYRKRTTKEKAELILNGGANAIKAILPVLDDMERAIENGGKTDDPEVLREGMELIYQKFQKALEGLGIKKIGHSRGYSNGSRHGRRQERQSH